MGSFGSLDSSNCTTILCLRYIFNIHFQPYLHVRNIAKNFLSGTIPADLGATQSLTKLYLL